MNQTRLFTAIAVIGLAISLTACSLPKPETEAFVEETAAQAVALASLPNGSLRYGIQTPQHTAVITDVDQMGTKAPQPLATIELSVASLTNQQQGLLGLTVFSKDNQERTFASWVTPQQQLVVGELTTGSPRIIWNGPTVEATATNIGGGLAITPTGRILVGVGNLGQPTPGTLYTLDPDRDSTQQPNAISTGWTNPKALTYIGDLLWIADTIDGKDKLGRVGENSFASGAIDIGTNTSPVGLTFYGESELVVCMASQGQLKRFMINSNKDVAPGRNLANNCSGAVTQLNDGRIAFIANGSIRVTGN